MAEHAHTTRRSALKALIPLSAAGAVLPVQALASLPSDSPIDRAIARWDRAKVSLQAADDAAARAFTHVHPHLVKGVATTNAADGPRFAKSEKQVRDHFRPALHFWQGGGPQLDAVTQRMNAALAELKSQQDAEEVARVRSGWRRLIEHSDRCAEEYDAAFWAVMDCKPRDLDEARRKMAAVIDELSGRMQDDTQAQCARHMKTLLG